MSWKRNCMYITVAIIGYLWLNYVKRGPVYESEKSLEGKTVLITGGNAGIGKATAIELAKRGARIIIASRNMARSKVVQEEIVRKTGNSQIRTMHLDLGNFESVRHFATEYAKTEEYIDYLINNAGISANGIAPSGLNKMYAVNYFGPFLLTNLLLDKMKAQSKTRPVRIINLTSEGYKATGITKEGMYQNVTNFVDMFSVYMETNLANVYFMYEMNKTAESFDITTYSVDPGMAIDTDIGQQDISIRWKIALYIPLLLIARTPFYGCQTTMYCLLDDNVVNYSGDFFTGCHHEELWSHAINETMGKFLLEQSFKVTGLRNP